MAGPNTNDNGRRPANARQGDYTGQERQRVTKEREEQELADNATLRAERSQQIEATEYGVFDAQTQQRLNAPRNELEIVDADEDDPNVATGPREAFPGFNFAEDAREPVFTGQEPAEVIERALTERRGRPERHSGSVARPSIVGIRTNCDIEKMTYGMINGQPNNFDFKEGLAYRIPLPVAEHLAERKLIAAWL